MSWANLDDRLHAHPKVRRLQRIPFAGAEAFGIWSWCLSWCRAYHPLDGAVVLEDVADSWNCDTEHMAEVFALLVDVRLLDCADEHFAIHDWPDWQLDGKMHQILAGQARAASAARTPTGTFQPAGPASTSPVELDQAGIQPGRTSPRLSTPRHSRARVRARETTPSKDGFEEVRTTVASLGFHPVPKPGGRKR